MPERISVSASILPSADEDALQNVPASKIEGDAMANRLRQALVGKKRVDIIKTSGLAEGTLTRALRGMPTRRRTLIALADALDVRQEWLIDGKGEMRPDRPVSGQSQSQSQSQKPPKIDLEEWLNSRAPPGPYDHELRLSKRINLPALATALRMAMRLWDSRPPLTGSLRDDDAWRDRANDVAVLYDAIADQARQADEDDAVQSKDP